VHEAIPGEVVANPIAPELPCPSADPLLHPKEDLLIREVKVSHVLVEMIMEIREWILRV
jgi:hypothetical protein